MRPAAVCPSCGGEGGWERVCGSYVSGGVGSERGARLPEFTTKICTWAQRHTAAAAVSQQHTQLADKPTSIR